MLNKLNVKDFLMGFVDNTAVLQQSETAFE